jgi:hypothetical protein
VWIPGAEKLIDASSTENSAENTAWSLTLTSHLVVLQNQVVTAYEYSSIPTSNTGSVSISILANRWVSLHL